MTLFVTQMCENLRYHMVSDELICIGAWKLEYSGISGQSANDFSAKQP